MYATDCCRKCPCTRPAGVTRTAPSDIAIVVDFPTDVDRHKDSLLNGDSGTLAKSLLKGYGIDPDECYMTTALNCRPNSKKDGVLKNAMLSCRERLVHELRAIGPSKVLCLGPIGFSALTSADKNMPITYHRGKWHQCYGMNVLATFNPTMVMGVHEYFRDMDDDIRKFAEMDGPPPDPHVEQWVVDSIEDVRLAFDYLEAASFVAIDVETTGFSPVKDDLLAVGIGVLFEDGYDGTSIIFPEDILSEKVVWREISAILAREDQATVMHNAKFDLKWLLSALRAMGVPYDPRNIQDTMLLHYCTDERAMGQFQSHSLKNLARLRCDAPDYDIRMGQWLKAWKDANEEGRHRLRLKMHTYLALDCYYTARLFTQLPDEVVAESPGLMDVYENLLMPGTLALTEIEFHGAKVDRKFYEDTWEDLKGRADPTLARLQQLCSDLYGMDDFNPNSPKQVKELVYQKLEMPFGVEAQKMHARSKEARASGSSVGQKGMAAASGKVSHTARRGKLQEGPTAKAVLKHLSKNFGATNDPHGLISDILEYRNLTKTAGTYVKGMLDRMDDDDRVRGDFLPHGTSTGRLSSANPNLQNIPEASHTKIEVRNGFVAPPDHVLISADYSQLELRIAAHLSDDDNFCQVYIDGRDVHQEVAFAFFEKEEKDISAYERYMAKCVNFGVVYGRGADSIANGPEMEYVEEIGGERWSTAQVSEFFTAFFDNFPKFRDWCDEQKRFAYKNQYVESPLGRRRRFPMIPRSDGGSVGRQAVNTPIQGTASDFTLSALVRIHARLRDLPAFIVSTVHDSILVECHRDYILQVSEIIREEMEDNVPIVSRVPFKVDIKYGIKWGDLDKVDADEFILDDSAHSLLASED